MKLIPYHTKIRCRDCGHVFIIRSTELKTCPRCWKRNLEVLNEPKLNEFELMRQRITAIS